LLEEEGARAAALHATFEVDIDRRRAGLSAGPGRAGGAGRRGGRP